MKVDATDKIKIDCADVITLLTGCLTVPVDRLYTLYNSITGDSLFTHQLPRAFKACQPHAETTFPAIREWLAKPQNAIDRDSWERVVKTCRVKFGNEFEIDPLQSWSVKDPISELEEMLGGDK